MGIDVLAGVKRKAYKWYIALAKKAGMKHYVIRYFIVWPPPHLKLKRYEDRACWYWNERTRSWGDKLHGTGYETREEAERVSLVAAGTPTYRAPGAEALGKVRTSRQLVRLVQVSASDV